MIEVVITFIHDHNTDMLIGNQKIMILMHNLG